MENRVPIKSIFLVAIMLTTIGFQASIGLSRSSVVVAQSASSCSPNDIFRLTLVTPPDSINANTLVTGSSDAILLLWEYLSLQPHFFPNGSMDTSSGVTDWISHNANYTVWTFNIKPGLMWSNGQNVTSNDILTSFGPKMYFNASNDPLSLGKEVKQEYAQNSSAAVFVLNLSDTQWANELSADNLAWVPWPASLINQYGSAYQNLGTNIVDGPFYVSNYTSGQFQMTLLRNPYFKPLPKICQIDVNFVETLSLTATPLLAGSTDLAQLEPSNAPSISSNPNLGIIDSKGLGVTTLQYNDTAYPYNMTDFRQALAFGINQSEVVDQAWNGYAQTAYDGEGIVNPVSNWYNPNIAKYSYNTSQSLSLLSSIGIKKGTDGFLQYPNGTDISLALWTDSGSSQDVVASQIVGSNLQSLGFKVNQITTSESNIVGDYNGNLQGIRNGIILFTTYVTIWGFGYLDILPGWDVYFAPTLSNMHWEYPAVIDNEYNSNFSAFLAASNTSAQQQYAFNIEAMSAQYLPTIAIAFPDLLWAYSIQHFTNWPGPTGSMMDSAYSFNPNVWENLAPIGSVGSSSSSTPTSIISTVTNPTTSGSQVSTSSSSGPVTVSSSSLTTSTGSSSLSLSPIVLVGIFVVIIIGGFVIATLLRRRR
jgi:ABC-type transport system substrate-binding protein